MTIDITPIIQAVVGLAAAVITAVLVPWIKSKTSESCQETLRGIVNAAVEAAEQTITGSGRGEEKKAWVIEYLKSAGVITDTNEEYVDAVIEAMVYGLKQQQT